MNKQAIVLTLLAVAMVFTTGCGSNSNPQFAKMVYSSNTSGTAAWVTADLDGSNPTAIPIPTALNSNTIWSVSSSANGGNGRQRECLGGKRRRKRSQAVNHE